MRSAENGSPSTGWRMTNRRPVTGLLWLLKWFVIITLLVWVIDIFCVFVLWSPQGVETLSAVLIEEVALLNLPPQHTQRLIEISQSFYHAVFVTTGIEGAMSQPYLQPPGDQADNMREFYDTFRPVVETSMLGLQLYALRLGVLLLTLPFVLIVTLTAASDGILSWYLRRTSGDRESGFIYHRAKRGHGWAYVLLCAIYLLPPVPTNPALYITLFLCVAGISCYLQVSYFKKFL